MSENQNTTFAVLLQIEFVLHGRSFVAWAKTTPLVLPFSRAVTLYLSSRRYSLLKDSSLSLLWVAQRFTAAINGLSLTPASAAEVILPRRKHFFRNLVGRRGNLVFKLSPYYFRTIDLSACFPIITALPGAEICLRRLTRSMGSGSGLR